MRGLLSLLAVLVALTAAGSASAMPYDQKLRVWRHVCLAADGRVVTSGGPAPTWVGCGHFHQPAWNAGTIRQFEEVCLNALGGVWFLYQPSIGTVFAEATSCQLVPLT